MSPLLQPGLVRARCLAAAWLVATLGAGCGGGGTPAIEPDPRLASVQAELLGGAIDPLQPGRGRPDYPDAAVADIPKADAMVIKAWATRPSPMPAALRDMAQRSLARLIETADTDGDATPGWGLPFAWDAFGDGTPNPAHTPYAISTAIVVDALLDRAAVEDAGPRGRLTDIAWRALAPFAALEVRTPGGMSPYSLTPQDRFWDVLNTSAYLAAMAQRLSREPTLSPHAETLRQFADHEMQAILDRHRVSATGAWYWPYLLPSNSVNDLPHAAYMIYAVHAYARDGGRLAGQFNLTAMWRHLREFVPDTAGGVVRAYPDFRPETGPARLYDVGFALLTLCTFDGPEPAVREALTASVAHYRTPEGRYAKFPVSGPAATDGPAEVITEYETYLLAGVSACLARPR